MGLDIIVYFANNDLVYSSVYDDPALDSNPKYRLSRTFCYLMCRKDVVSGKPELDQIGKLTSIDISTIYQMETFTSNEEIEFFLEEAETEQQKEKIRTLAQAGNDKIKGNIDKILMTITNLIDKLSQIDDLPELLTDNDYDTLDNKIYFADFNKDKAQGYIENNFGQDLRNLKRILEYAKAKGSTTVYFNYG